MAPLMLLLLGVSGVYCDSHSLRYYRTAISSPGSRLPVYSEVGYVDDRAIVNYNSDTRQCLPKVEWMKKLDSEYWAYNTQVNQQQEPIFRYNVQTAMNHFNQTGVRPEVKVWGHQSDGVTKLQCLVYGFHPRAVDVKWVRNREFEESSLEAKTILPHPDGTYQTRVSVEVPTSDEDSYSCHVDHSSLEEVLTVIWEPPRKTSWKDVAIYIVAGLVSIAVLVLGVIFIWRKWTGPRIPEGQNRGVVYMAA